MACTLEKNKKKIKEIYGVVKLFANSSYSKYLSNESLNQLDKLNLINNHYIKQKCNWLDLDILHKAIDINGCTKLVFTGSNTIIKLNLFKLYYKNNLLEFDSFSEMKIYIQYRLNWISIDFT